MIRIAAPAALYFLAISATLAQPKQDIIDSLARGWSGGRSTSLCEVDGIDIKGDSVSTCQWLLPRSQKVAGEVKTTRYKHDSAMVAWQRPLQNFAEMQRVVDSLSLQFSLRAMTMRSCPKGISPAGSVDGQIWEDKKLLVHISSYTPSAGPPKILVVGVADPKAYPDVICPRRSNPPGGR